MIYFRVWDEIHGININTTDYDVPFRMRPTHIVVGKRIARQGCSRSLETFICLDHVDCTYHSIRYGDVRLLYLTGSVPGDRASEGLRISCGLRARSLHIIAAKCHGTHTSV